MANHSELTRREQVLAYLKAHADQWVDGPELANEKVGGSEGLKRVRELRQQGHRIQTRPHPDRDRSVFQYRLLTKDKPRDALTPVVQEAWAAAPSEPRPQEVPAMAPRPPEPPKSLTPQGPMPMYRNDAGEFILTFEVCVECSGTYTNDIEHRTKDEQHLAWLAQQQFMAREHMDAPDVPHEQTRVDIPPQPPAFKFTEMPKKVDMGTTMICPRCKGIRRAARKSRKKDSLGELQEAEEFTRDPYKPTIKGEPNICPRCDGFGIVPDHVRVQDGMSEMPPGSARADGA